MARQTLRDPWAAHEFSPLDISSYLLERFQQSPLLSFPPRSIPPVAGIYGLYLGHQVVYVGKATRKSHLRMRIWKVANKISSTKSKLSQQLRCRFLLMTEEWVDYAKDHLVRHYQPTWNLSERDSPVHGAWRPGVKGPPTWDEMYPPK
jgi:hypothetical protein